MERALSDEERRELVVLFEHILNFQRYSDLVISEIVSRDIKYRDLGGSTSALKTHFIQSESVFVQLRGKLLK